MIRLNTLLIPPVKWPSWVWKLFRQFRCKSKPIGTPSLGFQLKFQRGWGCPFHQSQFCRARYPPNIWTANHCKHIAVHQKISENPTKHHFFPNLQWFFREPSRSILPTARKGQPPGPHLLKLKLIPLPSPSPLQPGDRGGDAKESGQKRVPQINEFQGKNGI